jgi:hypothetical protein
MALSSSNLWQAEPRRSCCSTYRRGSWCHNRPRRELTQHSRLFLPTESGSCIRALTEDQSRFGSDEWAADRRFPLPEGIATVFRPRGSSTQRLSFLLAIVIAELAFLRCIVRHWTGSKALVEVTISQQHFQVRNRPVRSHYRPLSGNASLPQLNFRRHAQALRVRGPLRCVVWRSSHVRAVHDMETCGGERLSRVSYQGGERILFLTRCPYKSFVGLGGIAKPRWN